ncbi:PaaI family thioesterase [Rhodococcus pyridinivorans]|uniref:PaaI family thioesterase n=1 Tax=Rhodococcus pyridinivorans TaxID=103816 RepID=A0A7M2XMR6_9NOCA|nr:PaaI family thioesterase [Rhodococcus pyridinivorans]QOV98141.1 PaaI family thioesterase [Rhodococcus pyridinivorans]WMM72023.1 PaaI family thioesterase [Rhodococcus pyridinivorans]
MTGTTEARPTIEDYGQKPPSRFAEESGFVVEEVTGTKVAGYVDLGPDHHTPWGVVHGGLYATIVETAGSIGASAAVPERGQFAVGVNNSTDFLRSTTGCRASVTAEPLQQGRTQQLWLVIITDTTTGKVLARGQLRLQNVPLPE